MSAARQDRYEPWVEDEDDPSLSYEANDPSLFEDNPFHAADRLVRLDDLRDIPFPEETADDPRPVLDFQTIAALCAEVDAAGPRHYLIRGIWPAGAYGVHAAEMKAQKTWNADDLAVSVASGTPWLGLLPVEQSGPVLIFAGEGGKAEIVRRLRAIARSRSVELESLPLVVCARAPHLANVSHLAAFQEQLKTVKPALVVLDPLYLAARGAKGSDLYAMGELLETAQHLCQAADTSLLCVTHFNRKDGSGAGRITGAGPAEWGRVLMTASVLSRHTDPLTRATTVVTQIDVVGGEIPDQSIKIRRRIQAQDPDDLDSFLEYHVEQLEADEVEQNSDLPPAARKLLEALEAADEPSTSTELVDWIAATHGHGLKRETVSRHLNELRRQGVVECTNPDATVAEPKRWRRVTDVTVTCDHTPGDARVTAVTPLIGVTRNGHTGARDHTEADSHG